MRNAILSYLKLTLIKSTELLLCYTKLANLFIAGKRRITLFVF